MKDNNISPDSLNIIKKLLALNLVKDLKGDDQVEPLARVGLTVSDISEILGKESNAINQAIFRLKKQGKLPKKIQKKK